MDEFVLFAFLLFTANKSNSSVRFLGEPTARQSAFWFYLTFNPIPCGGEVPHRPPLGVISCHFVGDAPTNPKFLDFSQFDPYFHLVKSFFTFFCNFYEKNAVKFFFRHKKERFFDENGQKHCFFTNIGIFCSNFVISML